MKKYETPDFIKIDFSTENVLDGSIVDGGNNKNNPIIVGPPINIFG